MKTTTVPAQITTVEDRIAGSLSLSQLMLLASPIFIGSAIYVLFPPMLRLTYLKLAISFVIAVIFGILAIRVKGRIILLWAIVIFRYNLRPRFYIFNKNDQHLRDSKPVDRITEAEEVTEVKPIKTPLTPALPIPEVVRIESAIADPRANFGFKATRKGDLRVHITEIK